eukprot:PITA_23218
MDVTTFFLSEDLKDNIFMSQPEGFVVKGHEQKVCKLVKFLYGLKQAPRAWYEKLTEHLLKLNFKHYDLDDATLFVKKVGKTIVYLVVYVDDLLMTGHNESYIASKKKELRKGFEMIDLGYVHYYLCIEVTQHPKSIFFPQKKYIGDLLNKFGIAECNPLTTPMEQNLKLTSIEGKEFEDATKYRQLVGSLNYLTTTRPNISFAIGILSRSMQKPCEGHCSVAKRALMYLREPKNLDSSIHRKILEDLQVKQVHSTPLMIDNTSAIKLVKNPKFHDQTKHINTKYHLIRHHVEAKTIHLRHCSTNEQIADIFTKALGRENLERFRTMLGLTNIPLDWGGGEC